MSSCIKDLYNYDLANKCSVCGILSLKSKIHKDKKKKRWCTKNMHNLY